MKHKSKAMLEVIRSSALFCSVLCYCMTKYPLHATSTQGKTLDTLYIIWGLLNIYSICDFERIAWRTTKWEIRDMPSLNLSSIFLLKGYTQNYQSTPGMVGLGGGGGVGRVAQQLCLNNWVISIGKVSPSNFVQVTTALGNLFVKHCQLMKKCWWITWDRSFSWQ